MTNETSTRSSDSTTMLANSTSVSIAGISSKGNLFPVYTGFSKTIEMPDTMPPKAQRFLSGDLAAKLSGDVVVASAVTAAVAPFLTVVDKAVVQRSAGSHTMLESMKQSLGGMVNRPGAYFRSPTFLWMWATYAATYSAANCLRTLTDHHESLKSSVTAERKAEQLSNSAANILFVGTGIVNTSASIIKDRAYAKMFGSGGPKIPKISYGMWMVRDFTVVWSSFVLPTQVSKLMQEHANMEEESSIKLAQVASPVGAQVIATPFHLMALDCCNRNLGNMSLPARIIDRTKYICGGITEVVAARMVRILPGYGIGGVYNRQFREQWIDYVDEQKMRNEILGRDRESNEPGVIRTLIRSNTLGSA